MREGGTLLMVCIDTVIPGVQCVRLAKSIIHVSIAQNTDLVYCVLLSRSALALQDCVC